MYDTFQQLEKETKGKVEYLSFIIALVKKSINISHEKILCETCKKVSSAISEQRKSRSACTSLQSDLSILCSLPYSTISIDSISGQ